jgi:hypothetical protein
LSENIKLPIYQIIGNFLKSNENKPYTISDLVNSLKLKNSTVTSSLTYLSKGRKVRKNGKVVITKSGKPKRKFYKGFQKGKITNVEKGKWQYTVKKSYVRWNVNFKVIETKTENRKREWTENMDLTAKATGIVPSGVPKSKVIEVSAMDLYFKTLDILADEGVYLDYSLDPDPKLKQMFLGAKKDDNQDMLNDRYDPRWEGEISFTNNYGKTYPPFKVKYDIMENEYD